MGGSLFEALISLSKAVFEDNISELELYISSDMCYAKFLINLCSPLEFRDLFSKNLNFVQLDNVKSLCQ